jgi:hypothetical protein
VTVVPRYAGPPAGIATVRSGSATVCQITLVGGKGECALSARALGVGEHNLVAVYPGSADFTGSMSAPQALTVVRQ